MRYRKGGEEKDYRGKKSRPFGRITQEGGSSKGSDIPKFLQKRSFYREGTSKSHTSKWGGEEGIRGVILRRRICRSVRFGW